MALTSVKQEIEDEINSFFPAEIYDVDQIVGSICCFYCKKINGDKFIVKIQYCFWSLILNKMPLIDADGSIECNMKTLSGFIGKKIEKIYFNNNYTSKIIIDDGSYFMCEDDTEFYGDDAGMIVLLLGQLNYVFSVKEGLFTSP